tara:strand:- start:414 stop:1604 length:1191 start_codon:yes stop_codon:yes gene_type:complete
MKVIQSYIPYNSPNKFQPLKDEMYVSMLSSLLINKHYGESNIYTNEVCKKVFNEIGIPYTNIDTEVLSKEEAKAFAMPKLKAMKAQTEPFLHLDLDSMVIEPPTFPEQPFLFSHIDQPIVKKRPKKKRLSIPNMFNHLNDDGWYQLANQAYYKFISYFQQNLSKLDFPIHHFDASTVPNMNIIKVNDVKTFSAVIEKVEKVYESIIVEYENQAPWELSCFIEQGCIHTYLKAMSKEYQEWQIRAEDTKIDTHVLFKDDPVKCSFYKELKKSTVTNESLPSFPLIFWHEAYCNSCHQPHSMSHTIPYEAKFKANLNLDKFKFWHVGGSNKTIAWVQAMLIGHIVKHFGVEEALKINSWFRDDRISKGYKPTLSPGEKMYEKLSGTEIFTSNWKKTLF